jgi:hypothetical protein
MNVNLIKVLEFFIQILKDILQDNGKWSISRFSFVSVLIYKVLLPAGDVQVGVLQVLGILLLYIFGNKTSLNISNGNVSAEMLEKEGGDK